MATSSSLAITIDSDVDSSSIDSASDYNPSKRLCTFSSDEDGSVGAIFLPSHSESDEGEAIFLSDDEVPSTTLPDDSQPELEGIANLLVSSCCNRLCVRQRTVIDILLARGKIGAMGVVQKRQWLADKIIENSDVTKDNWETKYIFAGKEMCKSSFCKVRGK